MDRKKVLRQLREIEKLAGIEEKRLAADDWTEDWKTIIAILMSARTTDKKTIPVAESLFEKFDTVDKLAKAKTHEIGKIIRPVNFYRNKSKYISNLAKIVVSQYHGRVPHEFDKLIELPGVGRKTANVFLAEHGHGTIGVDTHVGWISKQMGWTKNERQELVERDLKEIFPSSTWSRVNNTLVHFGQKYRSRAEKEKILKKIKKEV
jgi:endonuclease-3